MAKNKIKKEKKFTSFEIGLFCMTFLPNIAANLFITIFSQIFIGLPVIETMKLTFIVFFCFIHIFIILEYIVNNLMTKTISNSLIRWKTGNLDTEGRTILLKKLLRFPNIKSTETLILCEIIALCYSAYLKFWLNTDTIAVCLFLVSYVCLAYVYSILIMFFMEKRISSITTRIVSDGINMPEGNKKFFGNSSVTTFLQYIIIPIIGYGIYMYCIIRYSYTPVVVHKNGLIACRTLSTLEESGILIRQTPARFSSLIRITTTAIVGFICQFYLIISFFKRYTRQFELMKYTLLKLSETNDLTKENLFPVDFATESSYSMHLMNNTILLFDSLINKNININNSINASVSELSEIADFSEKNVMIQSNNVEEILSTMKNVESLSNNVETKISEVYTVAEKTNHNIKTLFESLETNIIKIQEITDSNRITVENMGILSEKIASIRDILNIINKVAEQTKTIAFNAKLEESYFNSQGQTFFEISTEIRDLTNIIMDLTSQIRTQIKEIVSASNDLIVSGSNCMNITMEGNKLCQLIRDKFKEIKETAEETELNSNDVKMSIYEQHEAFHQLVETLTQISCSINSFKTVSTEMAGTINELKSHSYHILDLNTKYKNINSGSIRK